VSVPQRGSFGAPEFQEVFAQHARFVWRVLVRLGVNRRDAPDSGQEVFLIVHRRLPDFDAQRSSLQSWLYGICLRVASDYRRRHPSRKEVGADELEELAAAGEPETAVATRRAWQRLALILDGIDEAKREVFVLYELEELPMSEVAALVGCPLQTAYSRLHAARRAVLAAYGDASEP
jgi:RNA polymerase sigma-70 factor, ECF subfamily